jgi:hypothetical protein
LSSVAPGRGSSIPGNSIALNAPPDTTTSAMEMIRQCHVGRRGGPLLVVVTV